MIRARFRIQLPDGIWVQTLSQRFSDATFALLSGYRSDETAVELGEVTTDAPDAVVDALRTHPSILAFERLESTERRVLGKYETTDTALYDFVEEPSLPIEFPVTVRNGRFEFDLTGTREELENLRATLEASGLAYELQSLVRTTETESLLTDRQRELLEIAIREGYFEVPRDCTLATVAEAAGIDKATASTILRRGEAKLVKSALAGPGRADRREP
ncbi:Bacterio-opsin activator HTH domain protein [Haloterrigena turkmenica DSM 5511]|uniref:Bacterio-opsin activator HTH domain protein n=1 Tax=Haloterrigena turkmenica (strain ATCC 51198 / DSM 5511 / JCM 9101 / NCIMB 13204 / VKM B-1734 / 4k) TaxID=543526 RepID=D2RPK6_HALTV|nr:helix-turn-helix domain-containing protein [Haloterrigena turkmenica]ADB62158.1 Bacterio-opsin activator HTH domain protein [Haloterrigena turkmenica DSM 5511]